jgi:colanic acid biosynthesis glycosyl transferase WcaI
VPHFNEDNEALAAQPLKAYYGSLLQKSNYQGIEVLHCWMPRKGKSKLLRIIAWLGFHAVSTMAGVFTRFKPDIIFTPSPPLTIAISAWLIGLWRKCPFIYNVQEIYPDVAVNLGVIRNSYVIKLFQRLEKFVYKKSCAIAVISDGMADNIRSKNVPEEKIHVIPNFVDIEDFHPLPKVNDFSKCHGLAEKFVISYAGNMGAPQGLEILIEAARILREEEDIHFFMMGDGTERASLMKLAKGYNLRNVTFLSYQPYSLMAEAYAAVDASFVSQAPGTSNDGIPSKVYRIMACARPVIACTDLHSDLARMIEESGGGVFVLSGSAEALADAILQAYNQRDAWKEKGLKARQFIEQKYARASISDQYHKLIMSSLRNGCGHKGME